MAKQLTLFKYSFATPRTRESTSGQQKRQKSVNETDCAQQNHTEASGQESQDSNSVCQQHLNSFYDTTAMTSSINRASDIPKDIATGPEQAPVQPKLNFLATLKGNKHRSFCSEWYKSINVNSHPCGPHEPTRDLTSTLAPPLGLLTVAVC